jgi:hypothetical protein
MSILGQHHSDPVSPALRATTQIKNRTARLAETIIREWEHAFDALWNNPAATPEQVLAELGTDAAEAFELSGATVQFMAAILPGRLDDEWARLQAKIATKPATTAHEDGTVTIDPA